MTDPIETPSQAKRRRLINMGEVIALAALIISALGLWKGWSKDGTPAIVVEKSRAIPLALRGKVENDGKALAISPVESGHALETLTLSAPGKTPLDFGSEPSLTASAVEGLLPEGKKAGNGAIRVTVSARYIEAGSERTGGGHYRIAYRWAGGGLFGGHSLRLTGFTRG